MEALNLTAIFGAAAAATGGGGGARGSILATASPAALAYIAAVETADGDQLENAVLAEIVLATQFRYISPSGNDSNDGSLATPWQTFAPALTWVAGLTVDSNVRIAVAAGAYTEQGQGLYFGNINAAIAVGVDFTFGVTVATSQSSPGNGVGAQYAVEATFNLKGAEFTGTNIGSSNGIGAHNSAAVVVNGGGATFTGYEDGWSNHGTSTATVRDCTFAECTKGALTHVDSSVVAAERCTFTGLTGATLGIGAMQNSSIGTFEDCAFIPAVTGQIIYITDGHVFRRCSFGSPSLSVTASSNPAPNEWVSTFEDCYLNLGFNGGITSFQFIRCFGRFGFNLRGTTTATPLIENCVFTGGAGTAGTKFCVMVNGYTPNVFDPGTLTIRNSIFTGYTHFIDIATGNSGAVRDAAKNAINAQWTMEGVCINGVTTVMAPATINLPSPYVTDDPLLINPTTAQQVDYNTDSGSPCRGAGVAGANIGLPA